MRIWLILQEPADRHFSRDRSGTSSPISEGRKLALVGHQPRTCIDSEWRFLQLRYHAPGNAKKPRILASAPFSLSYQHLPPESSMVQRPDGDKTREAEQRQRYDLPRVSGLMRPFPEQTSASILQGLTLNDVNSETIRQQIINNCTRLQNSLIHNPL